VVSPSHSIAQYSQSKCRQHQAIFLDRRRFSVAQQNHRWMPGRGIQELMGFGVEMDIRGGNQVVLSVAAKKRVQGA
jgi:hypothetical protein